MWNVLRLYGAIFKRHAAAPAVDVPWKCITVIQRVVTKVWITLSKSSRWKSFYLFIFLNFSAVGLQTAQDSKLV